MKRTLILYYSHSNGNTKSLAEELQKTTGGDLAAIETEKPYTGSYDEIVKVNGENVTISLEKAA